jgi:enoyl-CoA hydratase/carnithine racemase
MTEAPESSLIATREGVAGTILMNRPKALNALNQDMIRGFAAAIRNWRDDAAVKLVLLEGAGGRAFCAGGDVRAVRASAARVGHGPRVRAPRRAWRRRRRHRVRHASPPQDDAAVATEFFELRERFGLANDAFTKSSDADEDDDTPEED